MDGELAFEGIGSAPQMTAHPGVMETTAGLTAETSFAANAVLALGALGLGAVAFVWITKKFREGLSNLGLASKPT